MEGGPDETPPLSAAMERLARLLDEDDTKSATSGRAHRGHARAWRSVLSGIEVGMELEIKDTDAGRSWWSGFPRGAKMPAEGAALFPDGVARVVWQKLLHACEVEDPQKRYRKYWIGGAREVDVPGGGEKAVQLELVPPPVPRSLVDPGNQGDEGEDEDEEEDEDEDGEDDLPEEALFACELHDGRAGFLEARCGSCGYNDCQVGGAYACFHVARDRSELRRLAMDNEGRRWDDALRPVTQIAG